MRTDRGPHGAGASVVRSYAHPRGTRASPNATLRVVTVDAVVNFAAAVWAKTKQVGKLSCLHGWIAARAVYESTARKLPEKESPEFTGMWVAANAYR